MFSIIKKTANVWHHTSDTQTVHLSTFGVVADITAQTFIVRALNGAFFPRQAVSINDIQVIDETDSGTIETFATIDELLARLIQLQYPPYKTSGGGGGIGTLQEVLSQGNEVPADTPIIYPDNGVSKTMYTNGEVRVEDTLNGLSINFNINGIVSFITGLFSSKRTYLTFEEPTQVNEVVVPNESGTIATREWVEANPGAGLTADDITETATRVFVTPSEKTAITHANRSILDAITEAFTTALKTAYDGAVAWIVANGANLLNHLTNTSNPHNTTASQVGAYTTGQVDTLLTGKENTIPAGTTGQYYRGDKTFQTLDKNAVGLGNVDNISDLNKPISTATQTALNTKITQNAWVDISLTSTITGWSVFTTRQIQYLVVGNECGLYVRLVGTSNSTEAKFTLPFNYTGSETFGDMSVQVTNNGTAQTTSGLARILTNTNEVTFFLNGNLGVFQNTNLKAITCYLKFKIN